jgi:uncharacterized protein (TIGR01777 family)
MRVLVTGATGFIGRAVIGALLARGDEVTAFTRRLPETSAGGTERVLWKSWDPSRDGEWQAAIDGQNAIVHLAGEQAVARRLTEASKRTILQSRVESTERIVRGIELSASRPRVLVCASGVGYYGTKTGDAPLTEQSPAGDDFFAQVCVEWEKRARAAQVFGTRVVSARFGLVLGLGGGALGHLVPIFKAFIGGPLGSGKQPQPWIHLDDVAGAILKAIDDETLSGPVNVSAPNPVQNAELSKVLGRVLHRPSSLPAPGFALKALFGEGAMPLLTGQRALPRQLLDHGYSFRFTELEPALRDLLG